MFAQPRVNSQRVLEECCGVQKGLARVTLHRTTTCRHAARSMELWRAVGVVLKKTGCCCVSTSQLDSGAEGRAARRARSSVGVLTAWTVDSSGVTSIEAQLGLE